MKQIEKGIDEIPIISNVRRNFYKVILESRYKIILEKSYNKLINKSTQFEKYVKK